MKKFVRMICICACLLGLTACGTSDNAMETRENELIAQAEQFAENVVLPFIDDLSSTEQNMSDLKVLTAEEIEYIIEQTYGFRVKGSAVMAACESYANAREEVGEILSTKGATAVIDKKSIIVTVDVIGANKMATSEIVLSKDMFLTLESASLNAVSTTGDLMGRAGLNTLLGMGSVFIILILISLLISTFGVIPKIQNKLKAKKNAETGIDKAVAQIVVQEETQDLSDDLELVAVIAAAVAAYEGAASSDGYVVRSIRKIR